MRSIARQRSGKKAKGLLDYIPSTIHGNIRADVFSKKVPCELHASEPGPLPDHDCSVLECLERGLCDGGKLRKKKSEEMVDGLQAIFRKSDGKASTRFRR